MTLRAIHDLIHNETFIVDAYGRETCIYCGLASCNGCATPCIHCDTDVAYSDLEGRYLHVTTEQERCEDSTPATYAAPDPDDLPDDEWI